MAGDTWCRWSAAGSSPGAPSHERTLLLQMLLKYLRHQKVFVKDIIEVLIAWSVGLGASVPPGDNADERAVAGLLRDQRAAAVSLARVLAGGRGTQHGRGDAHLYLQGESKKSGISKTMAITPLKSIRKGKSWCVSENSA